MTRKDYVLIAAAIREQIDSMSAQMPLAYVAQTAKRIADALAHDNPRFDRERFLKACGFDS